VYLSRDGGQHWRLASRGMSHETRQRLDDVVFAPDGQLLAASHHGVYVFNPQAGGAGGKTPGDDNPGDRGGLAATGSALVWAWAGMLLLSIAAVVGRRRLRRTT
jgi:hypothetical protein